MKHSAPVQQLEFSADGRRLAVATGESNQGVMGEGVVWDVMLIVGVALSVLATVVYIRTGLQAEGMLRRRAS